MSTLTGGPDADAAIAERLARVRERIAAAAERSGRDPGEVRLVVVTKEVAPDAIRAVLAAGAADLGENRVQELLAKMDALAGVPSPPHWHFIGTLQRNKARSVAGRVAMIHSIDGIPLGRAVAARAADAGVAQEVLLEVNISGEPTKHGLTPASASEALEQLSAEPALRIRGLMTIAPFGDPAAARGAFRSLRELLDRLRTTPAGESMTDLSMGMTADFEEAIEEGATIVRIGTAIFGPRG